jgi:SAM-dependent methyltransferase
MTLSCPSCRVALSPVGSDEERCPRCAVVYRREQGIWRLLPRERLEAFREFVEQYEIVRSAEGWGVQEPHHLQALPFRDLSRRHRYEWHIRSHSYRELIRRVILPRERGSARPLRIADLGSGLGWLANRLAQRGHEVVAIDLVVNDFDGLGAHRLYDCKFVSVQAEFERLPILDGSVDVVVYNASFHYATDYLHTLREALRVLSETGCIVIMDSPLYRDPSSGAAMVRERDDAFERQYGFRGGVTEGYLTYDRLSQLGRDLQLDWELFEPWYGVRWRLKPWVASVLGWREPARFKLIVGCRLVEA